MLESICLDFELLPNNNYGILKQDKILRKSAMKAVRFRRYLP
jgi:hypothetical protein